MIKLFLLTYLLSFFFTGPNIVLQLTGILPDNDKEMVKQEQIDPLGRSNPKGTVKGFFKTLANDDFARASRYMHFSDVSGVSSDSSKTILAQNFETILNRNGTMLPINLISQDSRGILEDGLDPAFEEVGDIKINGRTIPVFLELVQMDDDQSLWLISSTTLNLVQDEVRANPKFFRESINRKGALTTRFYGAPLKDWLTIIFLAIGSYFLAWLLTSLIARGIIFIWHKFKQERYHNILTNLLIPLRLVIAVAILLQFARYLNISILVRQSFSVVNLFAMWIALFIFLWLLINTTTTFGEAKLRSQNKFGGLAAISFFRNTAKFVLVIVAILVAFHTIGVNVTAGIAALGVGGLALALGAQKTVENIVGGLSVVFDQPVSVGDFCRFGDTIGTVEKIGMRSTRIRTLNRTIITIPNSDFSTQLIENYSKRDQFLYRTTIGLRYETSADQMRFILVELRKILYAHPKVNPDPARVRFLGYANDSLQVELFAYTYAKDWSDFLGIQEDINLRVGHVIEESGTGFAFPSQTIYLSKDVGLSEEKRTKAEKKVQEWIESGELNIPEFDPESIESLKNSIDFPQKGTGK